MIRLTEEEICHELCGSEFVDKFKPSGCMGCSPNQHYGLPKAQLKKFADIIKSDYPETLFLLEDLKFWRDLLEEVSYVDFNSFDM